MGTRRRVLVIAACVVLAVAGCTQQPERASAFLDSLAAAREAGSAAYPALSLAEHLPNQAFTVDGARVPSSEHVVLGTVVSAVVASSHTVVDGAEVELDPGTTGAWWSVADMTIEVERAVGPTLHDRIVVQVPLRGPADAQEQLGSLEALGRVVVVVDDGRIVRNEGLLGLVDGDQITWPLLEHPASGEGAAFVDGVDTVEELFDAASSTRADIALGASGARL